MKNIIHIVINLETKEPFPVGDLSPEEIKLFTSGSENVCFKDHWYNLDGDEALMEGKTPVRKLTYKYHSA
jgi:hypothetical protein